MGPPKIAALCAITGVDLQALVNELRLWNSRGKLHWHNGRLIFWTDGACQHNQHAPLRHGGSGIYFAQDCPANCKFTLVGCSHSNQRAELEASFFGALLVSTAFGDIFAENRTDSKYVINGLHNCGDEKLCRAASNSDVWLAFRQHLSTLGNNFLLATKVLGHANAKDVEEGHISQFDLDGNHAADVLAVCAAAAGALPKRLVEKQLELKQTAGNVQSMMIEILTERRTLNGYDPHDASLGPSSVTPLTPIVRESSGTLDQPANDDDDRGSPGAGSTATFCDILADFDIDGDPSPQRLELFQQEDAQDLSGDEGDAVYAAVVGERGGDVESTAQSKRPVPSICSNDDVVMPTLRKRMRWKQSVTGAGPSCSSTNSTTCDSQAVIVEDVTGTTYADTSSTFTQMFPQFPLAWQPSNSFVIKLAFPKVLQFVASTRENHFQWGPDLFAGMFAYMQCLRWSSDADPVTKRGVTYMELALDFECATAMSLPGPGGTYTSTSPLRSVKSHAHLLVCSSQC